MGDNVQQCDREEGETALQDHETHLCHGGPCQRGLHRRLRQHDDAAENGCEAADHHQHRENDRCMQHHVSKADEQETAGVHHASMQQRRDGRRCLHDFRQPSMGWKLGGLQKGRHRKQRRRGHSERSSLTVAGSAQDRGDVSGAIGDAEKNERAGQRQVDRARDDEFLVGCAPRRDPIR